MCEQAFRIAVGHDLVRHTHPHDLHLVLQAVLFFLLLAVVVGIAYVVWSVSSLPFDWARISDGLTRAARIFSGAIPPSFARSGLLIDGERVHLVLADADLLRDPLVDRVRHCRCHG